MNLLYNIVRTFPFWAIPIGVAMISSSIKHKNKKKWGIVGAILILSSVAFLYFRGHFEAVPFLHNIFNENFE